MGKVLLGVMLILLGGTISTESYIIELTPDFIGSLLLLLALRELKIKDKSLKWSLCILTAIYLFNYIVAIVNPNGIPFELQPILVSGSLLWGIFIAVKIVQKARIGHREDCNLNRIHKWFKILFILSIVIGVGMITCTLTQGIINLISVWIFTIGVFLGIIPRYMLIYLFYKEFKNLKSNK